MDEMPRCPDALNTLFGAPFWQVEVLVPFDQDVTSARIKHMQDYFINYERQLRQTSSNKCVCVRKFCMRACFCVSVCVYCVCVCVFACSSACVCSCVYVSMPSVLPPPPPPPPPPTPPVFFVKNQAPHTVL